MASPNPLDIELVLVFGTVIATALIARATNLPITALEILAGILLVTFLAFHAPRGLDSVLVLGSLLIVFLAGLETNLRFLRENVGRALVFGLGGFLVPFVGLFFVLNVLLHAPMLVSVVGATVLADTSISIVYTTLQQFDLADLPFGRLILAGTLAINLVEDVSITATTFLTSTAVLFALGALAILTAAALLLPRLARALENDGSKFTFANLPARTLLFSLAVLALLSSVVGVPGILFVFVMGLIFSQWSDRAYMRDIRKLAFAVFVPLYFLAVGLKVDLGFVLAQWPALLVLVAFATAFKLLTIYPIARRFMGPARAGPVAVLMNTRLTSATVILLLTLALGLISLAWYSLLVSAVVLLALGSAGALRAFPAFRSAAGARELFQTEEPAVVEDRSGGGLPVARDPPQAA